jgi:hypothetical protein
MAHSPTASPGIVSQQQSDWAVRILTQECVDFQPGQVRKPLPGSLGLRGPASPVPALIHHRCAPPHAARPRIPAHGQAGGSVRTLLQAWV